MERRYARKIGWHISDLEAIYCPRCQERYNIDQHLRAVGDHPYELFCPHCELLVLIQVQGDT